MRQKLFLLIIFTFSTLALLAIASLVSAKNPVQAAASDPAKLFVIVQNSGGTRITNATVTLTIGSVVSPQWCNYEGKNGSWSGILTNWQGSLEYWFRSGNNPGAPVLQICCNATSFSVAVSAPGYDSKTVSVAMAGYNGSYLDKVITLNPTPPPTKPDLVIRNSSGGTSPAISGPTTRVAGQSGTYVAKTKNIGDGNAGGSTTRAWTSGGSNNADNFSIGSLAAGAISATRSFTTTWSSPGTYTVSFKADNGGVIAESNEGNNASSITVTVLGKPDLVIRNKDAGTSPSISGPTTIVAGVSGTYITRTRNRGDSTAAASTTRASTTGSSNNADNFSIGSLAPKQNSATRSFTTSWNEPGTYTVVFKADNANVVAESSEGNNTASLSVHVTGADLVIRNESGVTQPSISGPTTAFVGIDYTFTFVTKNIGVLPAAASTTRAWTTASSNNSKEYSITSLIPGTIHSIHSFTTSWSAPGTYTVHAKADNGGVVAEGNENNNQANLTVIITTLVPKDCKIDADPSRITVDNRQTTITATNLDPGKQYRFVLSNTAGVVFLNEIRTADANGVVTYVQSFQYVDGSGDLINLPIGDYLIHHFPIDDPVLKCVANVSIFSVTYVDDPEVILPTPFGPVCGTAVCLAKAFMNTSLGIVGGTAFLLMSLGAYRLIFAGGNPDSIKSGREIITAAVLGLIFVTLAVFILNLIGISILGLNI